MLFVAATVVEDVLVAVNRKYSAHDKHDAVARDIGPRGIGATRFSCSGINDEPLGYLPQQRPATWDLKSSSFCWE